MFAAAPVAIIDIGSNSVRLVVYSGAKRSPSVIFNEKVMAGLGRDVGPDGALGESARASALAALERFRLLTRRMDVVRTRVVATAAVRDASNGGDFLADVRALGFDPVVLPGDEEGRLAGLGVVSGIPDADGIVGDLGGGSLELVEVAGGRPGRAASLPFGILRLEALDRRADDAFMRKVAKAVTAVGFAEAARGRAFYMVGGSWRALGQFDMALADHPLPIAHQHALAPARAGALRAALRRIGRDELRTIPQISAARVPALPLAARMLEAVTAALAPRTLIVSSFGIREGLLYDALDSAMRARDPLIEAAREAGAGLGRFAQHGDLLDRWIAPAFDDEPEQARLRLAACLLADIAWAAHPDFRAERGIDMALHGYWVAIDAPGRVMLAQALFCAFGGGRDLPYPAIAALCPPEARARAAAWGHAIRLGQRLSGGVAAGLEHSRLERGAARLTLRLARGDAALLSETVERRLRTLAGAMGLEPEVVIGD
jgi:exopolyphosphatase/guanosine-5'-triphosphate,3'-diphosphate pyrophosphatase